MMMMVMVMIVDVLYVECIAMRVEVMVINDTDRMDCDASKFSQVIKLMRDNVLILNVTTV